MKRQGVEECMGARRKFDLLCKWEIGGAKRENEGSEKEICLGPKRRDRGTRRKFDLLCKWEIRGAKRENEGSAKEICLGPKRRDRGARRKFDLLAQVKECDSQETIKGVQTTYLIYLFFM